MEVEFTEAQSTAMADHEASLLKYTFATYHAVHHDTHPTLELIEKGVITHTITLAVPNEAAKDFFADAKGNLWMMCYDFMKGRIVASDAINIMQSDGSIKCVKISIPNGISYSDEEEKEKELIVINNVRVSTVTEYCPVSFYQVDDDKVKVVFECKAANTKFSFIMKDETIIVATAEL